MRLFAAVLFLALILPLASAAFEQVSHNVHFSLQEDGSARVLETYQLFMDSNQSSHFYDSVMSLNDISAWKNVTSLENLRIHVDTKFAEVSNVRIRAQRRQGCNPWTGTCYGTVHVEYEVYNLEPGSFMSVISSKPRTYSYSLNSRALSFETSAQGDVLLPLGTELTITLPTDSVITNLNPFPEYFSKTDLPLTGVTELKWTGPVVLARFDLGFTLESSLESEMITFFRDAQSNIAGLMGSVEGLALLLMVTVLLSSLVLLRMYRDSQRRK